MQSSLFRKKNLDKISSPEQLNEYIKVSNPSIWVILFAILLLLFGAVVWGIYGHLDTTIDSVAISENGKIICYLKEEQKSQVDLSTKVTIDQDIYEVKDITVTPSKLPNNFDSYALHIGKLESSDWVYEVTLSNTGQIPDGVYKCNILVDRVSPISFVMN